MNNEVKRFAKFILLALITAAFVDQIVGRTLETLFTKMSSGERGRANYIMRIAKPDAIVFGSSRALYHYDSKLLEDSLGFTAYNAGRSNQSILYHLPVLQSILQRHVPKLVILDLQDDELVVNPTKFERLSALYPYFHTNQEVNRYLSKNLPDSWLFSISRSLPFNSAVFAVIYRSVFSNSSDEDYHGFLTKNGTYSGQMTISDNCDETIEWDEKIENALRDFIRVCKSKNIHLVISISPRLEKYKCPSKSIEMLEQITKEENCLFYNYFNLYNDPELFFDLGHLNEKGAREFTSHFVQTALNEFKVENEVHR